MNLPVLPPRRHSHTLPSVCSGHIGRRKQGGACTPDPAVACNVSSRRPAVNALSVSNVPFSANDWSALKCYSLRSAAQDLIILVIIIHYLMTLPGTQSTFDSIHLFCVMDLQLLTVLGLSFLLFLILLLENFDRTFRQKDTRFKA